MNFEHINRVLKEIQAKAPRDLMRASYSEQKVSPNVEFVVDKALESNMDPKKKEQLQQLKDAGEFSRKRIVANEIAEKQLSNYFNREINKAIREGRLPSKKVANEALRKQYEDNKSKRS